MYNLLKTEFLKVKKSKEFQYIFLGICAISFILMLQQIYEMEVFLKKMGESYAINGLECFTDMISGKIYIIVLHSIFIIVFICRDFECRIIHSEYLAGYSRFQILMCKIIICFIANGVYMLCFTIISTAGITILYGIGQNITSLLIFKIVTMYLLSLLIMCTISSTAFIIAYIFRHISISISVWAIGLFLPVMFLKVLQDVIKNSYTIKYISNNSIFLLYNKLQLDMSYSDISYIILVCMVRIIVAFSITYIIFRKTELR
ncbi:ABC transporter permease [Clostridium butyricum]|uniref:ABC transporter permease n=1 Tax=Clostridium butyricum TaxID=1492 RepID=UPI0018AABDE4|nr:ABC transporter permease [Clostridium butyricum]MDB2156191.1 ABC transporter permease [Clostridium butyricum]